MHDLHNATQIIHEIAINFPAGREMSFLLFAYADCNNEGQQVIAGGCHTRAPQLVLSVLRISTSQNILLLAKEAVAMGFFFGVVC